MKRSAPQTTDVLAWMFVVILGFGQRLYAASPATTNTPDAQRGSLSPQPVPPSGDRKAGGEASLNPQPLPPAPLPLGEMRKAGGDPTSLNPQPLPPAPSPLSGEMRKAGGDPHSLNPQPLPPVVGPDAEVQKVKGKFGGSAMDANLTGSGKKSSNELTGSDGGVSDVKSRHVKTTHHKKKTTPSTDLSGGTASPK